MKNQLLLQRFIFEHKNWEDILTASPYYLSISRDNMFDKNLILFKYSQVESDLNIQLVRECRGIILDEDTFEVVSHPFDKFGNYGEQYADSIDWKNCWVQEKLDGSLCKVVKINDQLLWSTNGMIDAEKAQLPVQLGCDYKNFKELINVAIKNAGFSNEQEFSLLLNDNTTYMFELTSRYNRIVVKFDEPQLHYLGLRNNITNQETSFIEYDPFNGKFNKPNVYSLSTLDECIEAAKAMDGNAEGYVVCDKNYKRIKVKSPMYCSIHHLRDDSGVISYRRALEIIEKNEADEILTYFPEYKIYFDELNDKLCKTLLTLESFWINFKQINLKTRRDQAQYIIKHMKKYSGLLFSMLDGKISSFRDGLFKMYPKNKLLDMLNDDKKDE